jgi:hypothetical protein
MTDLSSVEPSEGSLAAIADRTSSSLVGGSDSRSSVVCRSGKGRSISGVGHRQRSQQARSATHDRLVRWRRQARLSGVLPQELVGDRIVAAVVAVGDALRRRAGLRGRHRLLVPGRDERVSPCHRHLRRLGGQPEPTGTGTLPRGHSRPLQRRSRRGPGFGCSSGPSSPSP